MAVALIDVHHDAPQRSVCGCCISRPCINDGAHAPMKPPDDTAGATCRHTSSAFQSYPVLVVLLATHGTLQVLMHALGLPRCVEDVSH